MKPTQASTETKTEGKLDELIQLDNQPVGKETLIGLDADLINSNRGEGASQNNTQLLGFEDNTPTMKPDNLKGNSLIC